MQLVLFLNFFEKHLQNPPKPRERHESGGYSPVGFRGNVANLPLIRGSSLVCATGSTDNIRAGCIHGRAPRGWIGSVGGTITSATRREHEQILSRYRYSAVRVASAQTLRGFRSLPNPSSGLPRRTSSCLCRPLSHANAPSKDESRTTSARSG